MGHFKFAGDMVSVSDSISVMMAFIVIVGGLKVGSSSDAGGLFTLNVGL